jgi:uncharacterized protein (TIGR00255 family)
MLRSMTGFGAAAGAVEGAQYTVEARSVNNRYLKPIVRLPEGLTQAEADVEKLIRQRISRGTVTVTVRVSLPDEQAFCRINTAAIRQYVDQLGRLEVAGGPMHRIDLASLLALPGVCEPPPLDELLGATKEGLMRLIGEALDRLVAMRQEEGRGVEADLLAHCDVVEENLAAVAEAAPQVVLDYQDRLARRVAELTQAGNVDLDEELLAREVAVFAERCDVAEEIARLGGHIEQFRQTLSLPAPTGRKLDFVAQEMLREANTIASKANSADIIRRVVEIKTAIDRIKEQVQNVE